MCEINIQQLSESITTFLEVNEFWNLYVSKQKLSTPPPLIWTVPSVTYVSNKMEIDGNIAEQENYLVDIEHIKIEMNPFQIHDNAQNDENITHAIKDDINYNEPNQKENIEQNQKKNIAHNQKKDIVPNKPNLKQNQTSCPHCGKGKTC